MNNVGMANMPMVPGPPVGPAMAMMGNGAVAPPVGPRPQQPINEGNKHLLNTYIYEYFLRNEMFDCARALLNSDPQIKVQDGPNTRRDENGNIIANGADNMDVDNKDSIDTKPADLPQPSIPNPSMDNPFLYEWFCLFWDMFNAQKGKSGNGQVNSYMNHTQNQSRLRQNQQQEMLRNMRPDGMTNQQQLQMMRMQNGGMNMAMKQPNSIAQRAMANNQNNPQMMHMLQQQKQGQMQRDPSDMDGNRARPSSPGSAENAPSPSKRPRLNEAPFNPGQGGMMPNGRPAGQGMPGQQVGSDPSSSKQQTVQLLLHYGADPASLNREQFATFQNQSPAVQQKTIQTYAQNLQQQQQQQMPKTMQAANGPPGQGSPMVPQGPDGAAINTYYNAGEMGGPGGIRPAAGGPNATQQAGGSNHALQDYQMQLMLLEQQNKKRLMMARQEQDGGQNAIQMPRDGPGGPGGPGAPPGAAAPFQGTSPQGARPGASPNPTDMKRGPQQMNPAAMGSPMAEGAQSRGSPNAMNFMANQMDPTVPAFFKNENAMAAGGNMPGGPHMNGLRPSSHPQPPFNGPLNPQQQQMMARQQGQMAGQPGQQMQWQQQPGGPGGPNGNQMIPQGQTPQQVQGTPQQRNAMPPPAQPAVAAAASASARSTSSPQVANAAPPTPSQTNKAAPKKKETKSAKDKRAATQKKSNSNLNAAGATPAAEPAPEPEAATPATPITPANPQQTINRPGQNAGPNQPMPNGQVPAPVPQPSAPAMVPAPDPNQNQAFNMDNMGDFGSLDFANPLATSDVLNDFDFDSFLHDNEGGDGGFDFSTTGTFMDTDGIET